MAKVHSSAIIEGNVKLGAEVIVGPGVVINGNVSIGDGTVLEVGTCVYGNVKIGVNNKIGPYVIIGTDPQDVKYKGEEVGFVEIGDSNVIKEFVTVHKPTLKDGVTKIGNSCMLMVGSHVAHDVILGDEVVLVNNVLLGGFTVVEDGAFISALSTLHQNCRIGKYVMIGTFSKITQDVPPFTMALGNPAEVIGINSVGLRRRNFSGEQRTRIKEVYKIIYRSEYTIRDAAKKIIELFPDDEYVKHISDFILSSKRGIVKGLRREESEDIF